MREMRWLAAREGRIPPVRAFSPFYSKINPATEIDEPAESGPKRARAVFSTRAAVSHVLLF